MTCFNCRKICPKKQLYVENPLINATNEIYTGRQDSTNQKTILPKSFYIECSPIANNDILIMVKNNLYIYNYSQQTYKQIKTIKT